MKRFLILGAGRSSFALIRYLLAHAGENEWYVTVGDLSPELAKEKIGDSSFGEAVLFDINDVEGSKKMIGHADIVISLLPPNFHPLVAIRCLEAGRHLLTASYVSDEMKAFDGEARSKGLVFLNECGLDPGIDHLSAMQVIDRIRDSGGIVTGFESFTGGLIAPETDPGNPWRYKFTWNPRNVVMAGQGTARYLHDGIDRYISYPQLFTRTTRVEVPGAGKFEGYANRDSLRYIDTYRLHGIKTMLRGTLRHEGFCNTWNVLVQLGCCDDTYSVEGVDKLTHAGFIDAFLPPHPGSESVATTLSRHFGLRPDGGEMERLRWSGFFDEEPVGLKTGTPARILEHILEKKWRLNPQDRDQIIMCHRIAYHVGGQVSEIHASLVATGTDARNTAMAKTVGLPLAISAKLIARDKIAARGVVIPISKEFYVPVLRELQDQGIRLNESGPRPL